MKGISIVGWILSAAILIASLLLAALGAMVWGPWSGFPLVIRLSYFAYFLLCMALFIKAGTAEEPTVRLKFQAALVGSAPVMLAFIFWAHS